MPSALTAVAAPRSELQDAPGSPGTSERTPIPAPFQDADAVAQAQTGSGTILAFALPETEAGSTMPSVPA